MPSPLRCGSASVPSSRSTSSSWTSSRRRRDSAMSGGTNSKNGRCGVTAQGATPGGAPPPVTPAVPDVDHDREAGAGGGAHGGDALDEPVVGNGEAAVPVGPAGQELELRRPEAAPGRLDRLAAERLG